MTENNIFVVTLPIIFDLVKIKGIGFAYFALLIVEIRKLT